MIYTVFKVEWDTKFFGFPVGRINLSADFSSEKLAQTLDQVKNEYRLVYVFLKDKGPEEIASLSAPCKCYDRKLVFEKAVPKEAPELDHKLRLYTESACTKRLEMLAVISGQQSRFSRDPQIKPFYEQLFLTWINNSVLGGMADAIWTWRGDDGKPSGLATVRVVKHNDPTTGKVVKEARIGMLAVEEKYRRQGVATSLLKACEYWSVSLDLDKISLVVPADCPAYVQLCEKAEYQPGTEVSVYHYWTPDWVYHPKWGWKYGQPTTK